MPTNLSTTAIVRTPAPAPANAASRYEVRQNLPDPGQTLPPVGVTGQSRSAELNQAVSAINNYVQNLRRDLQFTVDEQTDRTIIRVIDSETREVIRQIPSEEVLALARSLERTQGLILRAQA